MMIYECIYIYIYICMISIYIYALMMINLEKVSKALRVLKLAGGHGAGGKGWKLMRKTVQEEVTSGNNWREWKREEDYEG
jgi:hypothetical protein